MKKTILYKTLFFCWAILALTGCDLDLQKNYGIFSGSQRYVLGVDSSY